MNTTIPPAEQAAIRVVAPTAPPDPLPPPPWKSLDDLLADERKHLDDIRDEAARRANPTGAPIGLALSGGGIRSATFSLGVLQALAQREHLRRIDYLSTVSGGGYIGAWLSACLYHVRNDPDPIGAVEKRIKPTDIRDQDQEPAELRFLRAYSNYLTPRVGALSGDTLAAAAGFVRNMGLNLLLGVLSMGVVLSLLHALIALVHAGMHGSLAMIFLGMLGGGLLLVAVGGITGMLTLQSYDVRDAMNAIAREAVKERADVLHGFLMLQRWVSRGSVIALCAGVVLGSIAMGALLPQLQWWYLVLVVPELLLAMLAGSVYSLMVLEIPTIDFTRLDLKKDPNALRNAFVSMAVRAGIQAVRTRREALPYVAACLASVAALAGLLWLTMRAHWFVAAGPDVLLRDSLDLVVHAPWVFTGALWLVYLVSMAVVGNASSEFTREWLSRLMGSLTAAVALWWAAGMLVVHAAPAWQYVVQRGARWLGDDALWPAIGVAALLVVIALAIKRLRTPARSPQSAPAPESSSLVGLASLVAVLAVVAVMIIAFQSALSTLAGAGDIVTPGANYRQILSAQLERLTVGLAWLPLLAFLLASIALAAIAFRLIDVNTFSLQNLYRNRLVRCYLGAAHHRERVENPYAGFDPKDDIELRQLAGRRPYLLATAALNITQGADLAWQQRKAASFLFSPRYCGFWLESTEGASAVQGHPRRGGYARTEKFVHEPTGFRDNSQGVMLGTVMATSGAAVSSQMGFASRGPLAFLLTLLNVRLGRWLPNPALRQHCAHWHENSPRFGAYWYLRELLGITNEHSPWVYVSDGGHFENTGLYELVRRRCELIVCVDAGADPHGGFGDLGNAVRKCRIDFGANIHVDTSGLKVDALTGRSEDACAIGTIDYPRGRKGEPRFQGRLVYIKPVLPKSLKASTEQMREDRPSDRLPADVLAYQQRHREFPQQPTTDQWFTESQFESYRQLGFVLGMNALKEGQVFFDEIASRRPRK